MRADAADAPFRALFVVCFSAVVLVTLYHRMRSWASGEKLDRWQEGPVVLITLRAAGLVLWLAVAAYMVDPSWMAWSSWPLPPSLRWLGVALNVVCLGLLTWTLRSLGTNLTDTVVTRRDHTLVTQGPYRFVRHPFYGSVALLIVASAMVAANWFFLLAGVVVLGFIGARTRKEEEHLVARFGEAYRAYMKRTGRFVPRWPINPP
jgi:protein-S-isoprenylcysteine O-methyltransferase Ste14